MLSGCGKLSNLCGKAVQKHVEKSVQKACKKVVQKIKLWNKNFTFAHLSKKSTNCEKLLPQIINKFLALEETILYLLNGSFPLFPHRTTITTTAFIYKGNDF